MFKSAYLKLTIYYVSIIMLLSVSFSIIIYRISYNELNRGLGRGIITIRQLPQQGFGDPMFNKNIENIINEKLTESSNNLKNQLIYINALILLVSTLGSYFLAKKTLKPIEEMMDGQNRFTADASHELKTPLTAMRSEIEVGLRDKKISLTDAKKLLSSNLEEISKLESLSNALLKLAKYQEDFKKEFKKIELQEIIIDAYGKVEYFANRKNIRFENNLSEVFIKGDKQSLTELFVILLDNAIKYSPQNSEISIEINNYDKFAYINIKDYGIGIKASDLPYIFNRFYRADHSRNKEKISGYGLGLAIAKNIVDLHGGEIMTSSKIGKGSNFAIKLPKFK